MSAGPERAPDKLNTFGIVIIGVVTTLLTWALIVALQAYYGHTQVRFAEAQEVAGQDAQQRSLRAQQENELRGGLRNSRSGTGTIPIERAMEIVRGEAKRRAPSLVPAIGLHNQATVPAVWGRPLDNVRVRLPAPRAPLPAAPLDDPTGGGIATPLGATGPPGYRAHLKKPSRQPAAKAKEAQP